MTACSSFKLWAIAVAAMLFDLEIIILMKHDNIVHSSSSPTVLLLLIDGTVSYTAVLNCAMGPQVLIDLQRKGDALQLKTEKCPASDPEKEDGVKDKQAKTKELLAIGLGVGVALLLLIIGGLFCLYMYRRCRNRNQENGKVEGQGLQDLQAAKKNLLSSNSSG